MESDYALGMRARRLEAESAARYREVKVDQERFHLRRQQIYLAVELVTLALILAIAIGCWLDGERTFALAALGGGAGWGGVVAALNRLRAK